jgi:hypothetical protein
MGYVLKVFRERGVTYSDKTAHLMAVLNKPAAQILYGVQGAELKRS